MHAYFEERVGSTDGQSSSTAQRLLNKDRVHIGDVSFDVSPTRSTLGVFKNIALYGAQRNASSRQSGDSGSFPVGQTFATKWGSAKDGDDGPEAQKRCRLMCKQVAELFGFQSFDLTAHRGSPVLSAFVDNEPRLLEDLGSGVAQAVHLLGNAAIRPEPYTLMLIDEPEMNVHPAKQGELIRILQSHTTGCLMFATHSLGVVRELGCRTYSLHREEGNVQCREVHWGSGEAHDQHLVDLAHELGVPLAFATGFTNLLLVEGPEDIGTVLAWLRLLGRDSATVVMHLGGDSMIRAEPFEQLRRIGMKLFVLVDGEHLNSQKAKDRLRLKGLLRDIGLHDVLVTERPSIEHYLPQRAITEARIHKDAREIAPNEMLNKDVCHNWAKKQGSRIAKLMRREEIELTDVGKFLMSIPT